MNLKIDRRFRPSLKDKIGKDEINYLGSWGITLLGNPAPATEGLRAAAWIPKIFNERGEAPVILVSSEIGQRFDYKKARWYGGVALQSNVVKMPDKIESYLAEVEYYAPDIVTAINLARNFVSPAEKIPEGYL